MTPREFWHSTPRKLAALCQVHKDMNTPKDTRKEIVPKKGTFTNSMNYPKGGVGAPDTFIDQLNLPK